jgi:hypothetical protein
VEAAGGVAASGLRPSRAVPNGVRPHQPSPVDTRLFTVGPGASSVKQLHAALKATRRVANIRHYTDDREHNLQSNSSLSLDPAITPKRATCGSSRLATRGKLPYGNTGENRSRLLDKGRPDTSTMSPLVRKCDKMSRFGWGRLTHPKRPGGRKIGGVAFLRRRRHEIYRMVAGRGAGRIRGMPLQIDRGSIIKLGSFAGVTAVAGALDYFTPAEGDGGLSTTVSIEQPLN